MSQTNKKAELYIENETKTDKRKISLPPPKNEIIISTITKASSFRTESVKKIGNNKNDIINQNKLQVSTSTDQRKRSTPPSSLQINQANGSPKIPTKTPTKQPSFRQHTVQAPSVSVIAEVSETEITSDIDKADNNSLQSSNSTNFSRSTRPGSKQNTNLNRKTSQMSGRSVASSNENLIYNSTSSSIHGSVHSLPVTHEQYFCCERWSKKEKSLMKILALLVVIILGLVITIGILARRKEKFRTPEHEHDFFWSF